MRLDSRHDLHEMLVMALLSMLVGGRTRVDMEDSCAVWEPDLRRFMRLPHGVPNHDAFSDLFRAPDPAALQTALLRMARDWGTRRTVAAGRRGDGGGRQGPSAGCGGRGGERRRLRAGAQGS